MKLSECFACQLFLPHNKLELKFLMNQQKSEQAGTELCQAQSELIQIGRFLGQICIFGRKVFFGSTKNFWLKKFSGQKIFSGQKKLRVKNFLG